MKFLKTLFQIVVAIVFILFGLHYYLSNHTIKTVAEVKCQTNPTTFIQSLLLMLRKYIFDRLYV